MLFRKAHIDDVKKIHELINSYANKDLMLPRSLNELYENIRDFWVCESSKKIIGCAALHAVGWERLAEIKSLAVAKNNQRKRIGYDLVLKCLSEAKDLKANNIFVLTYVPQFFKKLGFKKISKTKLPHKIWADCYKCPKFPNCQEEALVKRI